MKSDLFKTLRDCHAELCEPPEAVKSNPERMKTWKPRVKPDIQWAAVEDDDFQVPDHKDYRDPEGDDDDHTPEFLTIGLIGQPNVGKSSLLNALFGSRRVKASRTPGKVRLFCISSTRAVYS